MLCKGLMLFNHFRIITESKTSILSKTHLAMSWRYVEDLFKRRTGYMLRTYSNEERDICWGPIQTKSGTYVEDLFKRRAGHMLRTYSNEELDICWGPIQTNLH